VKLSLAPQVFLSDKMTGGDVTINLETHYTNAVDAVASGAIDGLKLAANVAAMLIAFLGLLAALNGLLGWIGSLVNLPQLSLEWIFSYLMAPLAWLMGRVHLIFANMSVGAKHDRSKYQITTNNLYTVMLRPLQN
jgi:nucleoside permease NupC